MPKNEICLKYFLEKNSHKQPLCMQQFSKDLGNYRSQPRKSWLSITWCNDQSVAFPPVLATPEPNFSTMAKVETAFFFAVIHYCLFANYISTSSHVCPNVSKNPIMITIFFSLIVQWCLLYSSHYVNPIARLKLPHYGPHHHNGSSTYCGSTFYQSARVNSNDKKSP